MIRIGRKATASIAMTAIASVLAAAAGPLRAAEEAAKPRSPRLIDFRTCAKPEYPKADLRAEHVGMVTVLFLVAPDGTVKDSKIARSSGYEGLDQAARTALAACRFAPAGAMTDAATWLPIQYVWSIDGVGGAGAAPMSPGTQEQAFLWAARVLARYRYRPEVQTSNASAPVLDRYLKALDPDRMLFTRSDIANLEPQREQLAGNGDSKQLAAAFAMFDQMFARRMAMMAWTGDALRGPLSALDGNAPGPRPADAPWPASDAERQALWRQRAADAVRSLRNAGSSDKDIVATLTRRNDNQLARLRALSRRDAFELFMNAYVSAFDPHGAYFAPPGPAPSRVEAPGRVGVGLTLKKQGEWVTAYEVVGDGPAWRSGQLHVGDRIVGVAQGAGQPATDIVGWDLSDVVALMRGLPGSTVVLSVSPANAPAGSAPRSVALVRNPVSGHANARHAAAKLEVLDRSGVNYRIAVVTIPAFYEDFAAKRAGISDYASMTRDVAGLLASMKAQHADAVLLDMRRNGGGSFADAVDFAGLFLPGAPVAQQRELDSKVNVKFAPAGTPAWDGPLAVLIDERSAAATEIFAAAIQDHGRGLVMGDPSVGRTSVQTMISLDRFAPNRSEHYGTLKMTVAQAYRVSGKTFEQAGVIPDIGIPGVPDSSGIAHQLAFPAVPIKPVEFSPRGELKAVMPVLSRRHETRTAADTSYQAMLRARTRPSGNDGTADADIARVQLGEALQVIGDQIELLRTGATAGQ